MRVKYCGYPRTLLPLLRRGGIYDATRCDFNNERFHRLVGVDLTRSGLRNTWFTDCTLSRFHDAFGHQSRFIRCNLINADFREASLADALFDGSIMQGADFREAKLRDAKFTGCDLAHANFDGVDLRDTIVINCTVANASFNKAVLTPRQQALFGGRYAYVKNSDCIW